MIIFITGTPGTGKTTVSQLLKDQLPSRLVDINQLVEIEELYTGLDEERGYKVVDINALCSVLHEIILKENANIKEREDLNIEGIEQVKSLYLVVEGHLSHLCAGADVVIVLRTHPHVLKDRLAAKGFKEAKIRENVEAEALDVCAFEAYQEYKDRAHEIDTTSKKPQEIVNIIKEVITGEKSYPVGEVDFSDTLLNIS
ncbi:MAG TPA: adenylate kinase family protein [Methanobacterium sp.]|nr:adenylate kinase family protein [Methanobacterium sp.]